MNAAKRGVQKDIVEPWQCVKITWDHSGAFARMVLASIAKKANVMASVTVKTLVQTK